MKLADLIVPDIPCELYHPTIGRVSWRNDDTDGWGLFFADGPEEGEFLVADETIVLGKDWELKK
jgi:hypothetical protein